MYLLIEVYNIISIMQYVQYTIQNIIHNTVLNYINATKNDINLMKNFKKKEEKKTIHSQA